MAPQRKLIGFAVRAVLPGNKGNDWEILKKLEERIPSLRIICIVRVQLTAKQIMTIYKNKKEARLWQNQGGLTMLCIAEGDENIVEDFRKVCGERTFPADCDKDSIRYLFGKHEAKILEETDQLLVIYNAIHRPTTDEESDKMVINFIKITRKTLTTLFTSLFSQ